MKLRVFHSKKPKWDDRYVRTVTHPTKDPATCLHQTLRFTKKPYQKWCEDCGKVWPTMERTLTLTRVKPDA